METVQEKGGGVGDAILRAAALAKRGGGSQIRSVGGSRESNTLGRR